MPRSAAAHPPPPRVASSIDGRAALGQFQPPPRSPHPVLCRRVFAVVPRPSSPSRPRALVLQAALRRSSSPAPASTRPNPPVLLLLFPIPVRQSPLSTPIARPILPIHIRQSTLSTTTTLPLLHNPIQNHTRQSQIAISPLFTFTATSLAHRVAKPVSTLSPPRHPAHHSPPPKKIIIIPPHWNLHICLRIGGCTPSTPVIPSNPAVCHHMHLQSLPFYAPSNHPYTNDHLTSKDRELDFIRTVISFCACSSQIGLVTLPRDQETSQMQCCDATRRECRQGGQMLVACKTWSGRQRP